MRTLIAIIVLVLNFLCGYSQLSLLNKYIQFNNKTEVHPITTNEEIGLPLVFFGGNDIVIIYLDSNNEYQLEIALKKSSNNTRQYLGGYLTDSTLVLAFSNKKMTSLTRVKINLATGDHEEITNEDIKVDRKYLASWEVKDSLIVLSIVENSNILVVNKYFGESNGSFVGYEIDLSKFKGTLYEGSLYSIIDAKDDGLQKITSLLPISLYTASAKNKTYKISDNIVITLDGLADTTFFISLSLKTGGYEFYNFPFENNTYIDDGVTKINSFIYDDNLFQVRYGNYNVGIKIHSLKNQGTEVYFSGNRKSKADFANSGFIKRNEQEGLMYGHTVKRNIKKSKKFYRMAAAMKPSITVFKNKSNYQLVIGAVTETQNSRGVSGSMFLTSGGDMKVGKGDYLVMPDPIYYFPSNYSFTSYLSRKSVYFYSVINSVSLTHSTTLITKYTYNFIQDYANLLPGNNGLVTIFKFKGDYYLGYYSYASQTYNVEWFKNVDDYSIQF